MNVLPFATTVVPFEAGQLAPVAVALAVLVLVWVELVDCTAVVVMVACEDAGVEEDERLTAVTCVEETELDVDRTDAADEEDDTVVLTVACEGTEADEDSDEDDDAVVTAVACEEDPWPVEEDDRETATVDCDDVVLAIALLAKSTNGLLDAVE